MSANVSGKSLEAPNVSMPELEHTDAGLQGISHGSIIAGIAEQKSQGKISIPK
jgi:hypothetical protein